MLLIRRSILVRSVLKFVAFFRKVHFYSAFGNVAIITEEAYEVSDFGIVINFDLHSNSHSQSPYAA